MKDLSPLLTYPMGLLFLLALTALVLGVMHAFKFDRQIQAENDKAAGKKVAEILEQIGWESKQRWVNDDEIEYVSILLRNLVTERHKAWVRIRVNKSRLRATIEYWWNTGYTERAWIEKIARHFEKRGAQVVIRPADCQPRPEEIYVPDVPVRDESDDPNPPSD